MNAAIQSIQAVGTTRFYRDLQQIGVSVVARLIQSTRIRINKYVKMCRDNGRRLPHAAGDPAGIGIDNF